MADFCLACSKKLGFPEPDIKAEPGMIIQDLCEGCGVGWFDDQGRRLPEADEPTAQET